MSNDKESLRLSDTEFWQQALRHRSSLYGQAYKLSRQRATAEDLVQTTFEKALRSKDRFEPGTNMRAWLGTILKNQFYSNRRKLKRECALPDGYENTVADTTTPQYMEERDEEAYTFEVVAHCLAELSDDKCDALVFVTYGGYKYDEAAAELRVSVGTIKSRIHRACEGINTRLQDGRVVARDMEVWLTQKILGAHTAQQTKLARVYEALFVSFGSQRKRVATTDSHETTDSANFPIDDTPSDIESLFDDY